MIDRASKPASLSQSCKTAHVTISRRNVAALGFSRLPRAGFRLDLDDHHEEAMRGESNWTSGDGGDGEWAPEDDGADIWVGALTGIAAHADASEVGVGAHRCDQRTTVVLVLQSCGWKAREAGEGLRRARTARHPVEGVPAAQVPKK